MVPQETMIVCDLDATLLRTDQSISRRNIEAIDSYIKRGGTFTVATGRRPHSVNQYLDQLTINAPAILYNGAMVYDFGIGTTHLESFLDNQDLELLEDIFNKHQGIGVEIYSDDIIYFVGENIHSENHKRREGFEPIYVEFNQIPKRINKVVLADDPTIISMIVQDVNQRMQSISTVRSEPQFFEILPKTLSKGAALSKLLELPEFTEKFVISIGDNLNDLELLEKSDIGIAVDNAHTTLKEMADYITLDNNSDIIVDVLQKLFGRV